MNISDILKQHIADRAAAGEDVSGLELAYHYFIDPIFRAALEAEVWRILNPPTPPTPEPFVLLHTPDAEVEERMVEESADFADVITAARRLPVGTPWRIVRGNTELAANCWPA